jgi:vacuolar-type H+-ATPase subunit H
MAIAEVLMLERDVLLLRERLKVYDDTMKEARKEAEFEIKEAKLKAKQIVSDAENTAKNIILKKERIEREIKEFIQGRTDIIKKYEGM